MDLIDAHLAFLRSSGYAADTLDDRRRVLRTLDNALLFGIADVTPDELTTWMDRPDWSTQTKATYRGHIVGFYRWAAALQHLCCDPSTGLVRPKVPQGLPHPATEDELRQALAELPEPWRLYCLIAAYTGARAGEVSRLNRHEVTPERVLLHGKGGKDRYVPTDPYIWAAVEPLPAGAIAVSKTGLRRSPGHVSTVFGRMMRRIGLAHLTLHSFRHRFATVLLAACGNLRVVQELLGHASPTTTAIYTLVTDAQRRDAIAKLPRLA